MTKGLQMCLVDVIPNNALTVYNVIWDIDDITKDHAAKLAAEGKLQSELEKLQTRLEKVFLNKVEKFLIFAEKRIYSWKNVQNIRAEVRP